MNCRRLRRRLLAAERPDRPSAELQAHLDECSDCRNWQKHLSDIERQIALLPVPPSAGKDRLLRRLSEPATTEPLEPMVRLPDSEFSPRVLQKERGLRKTALAFALAATVFGLAIGLWAWPRRDPQGSRVLAPADAYDQTLGERRRGILEAPGLGRDRVATLLDFEHSLTDEAEALARAADLERLSRVVSYYEQVVGDDFFEQAERLPPLQRREALETGEQQFAATESRASRFATQLRESESAGAIVEQIERLASAADRARRLCQARLADAA
jgi:hypothetical protein